MKKVIPILTLISSVAITSTCYADVLATQQQIINQVEANLPDLNKKSIPTFSVLSGAQKAESNREDNIPQQQFYIEQIQINNLPSELKFLQAMVLDKSKGLYGIKEINTLLAELNNALMDKGYVTSKVYIQPQNLSNGKLTLDLLVGKIEAIKFTGAKGNYTNALAFHTGDILNIRQVEQTVDNLNSLLHQKATVKLEPGSTAGSSIVIFNIDNQEAFEVNTSFDNFGNEATGKLQGNISVAIAKPFELSDNFYYSYTKSFPFDKKKASTSQYYAYQIPVGNDTISLSHSYADYEQEISYAINPFKSSGDFTTDELKWNHLLNRNSKTKTQLINKITHKTRHSFINDNEIDVQKRRTTAWEIGLEQLRYIKDGMVDTYLGYARGMHWWANPGPTDQLGDATTNYNLYLAKLNYTKQFPLNKKYKGTYKLEFKGQYTTSRLYASEFFNLGGWYNVRGFSGDLNLAAENGFFLRNTLELPTSKVNTIYVGLDYGKVSGTYSSELLGQELTGGVIGVKGQYQKLSYNIFGAYPISKPTGFKVPNKLLGLQFNVTL